MTFFTSDLLFFDKESSYKYNRPNDYIKTVIKNWNARVKEDDIVFILGNLTKNLGNIPDGKNKLSKIMKNLNGNKILIKGLYDTYPSSFYISNADIKAVYDYQILGNYFLSNNPLLIDIDTTKVERDDIFRLMEIYRESPTEYIVHGYMHDKKMQDGKRINICIDRTKYFPIKVTELEKLL